MNLRSWGVLVSVVASLCAAGWAEDKPGGASTPAVKLPAMFSDHMVLQREMKVPVWGTAAAGTNVTVKFRDQTKTAVADATGNWSVKLDPLQAGGPDTLTVNDVTFQDVLVGEVWVGSGQSNMADSLDSYNGDTNLMKVTSAPYPKIRYSAGGGPWIEVGPKVFKGLSCQLFPFGIRLHEALNVPVGLMFGAQGSTCTGHWMTQAMLQADAPAQALLAKGIAEFDAPAATKWRADKIAAWELAVQKAREAMKPEPSRPILEIRPGTWVGGGKEKGPMAVCYNQHILPMVGYGIRGVLWDQGENGIGVAGLDMYHAMGVLIRGWRQAWGQGDFPFLYVQKPSGGGCAWDPTDPVTSQAHAFAPLPDQVPTDGLMNLDFIRVMQHPNTTMVTSSDLGSGLHPVNKLGYATRAATVALRKLYGFPGEYYGPVYARHEVQGDTVRIKFTHVGQGLGFRHGDKLQGFALAGADKKYHWAEARIEEDTVVLSAAKVPNPVYVNYAMSTKARSWANLFNKDGLPALSFAVGLTEKP